MQSIHIQKYTNSSSSYIYVGWKLLRMQLMIKVSDVSHPTRDIHLHLGIYIHFLQFKMYLLCNCNK